MTNIRKRHRRVVFVLLAIVIGMSGFAFVLIPIYRVMSNVYGFGGEKHQTDTAKLATRKAHALRAGVDSTRTIHLQFMVIDNSALQVRFRPLRSRMSVHPGELREVKYSLRNDTGRNLEVQGMQGISPELGARYLVSMGSLCCKQIALRAGESRTLSVKFVIDPDVPKKLQVLTMSYRLITR